MMHKRLKQLVIDGAVLVAVALGGSASAGAATGSSSGSSSAMASLQASSGGASPILPSTRTPGTTAHKNAETTITADDAAKASDAPLTRVRGGSVGAMHPVRDSWIHDVYLTDHEQYIRHHQRLRGQADDAPRLLAVDHIADVSYALPAQIITTGRSPSQLGADDPGNGGSPDCRDVRLVRDD